MTQIFSRIGLRKLLTLAKHRIIYRFHRIEISLDHVAGLGSFVELEAKHRVSSSHLLRFLEEIGIDRKMVVPESYIELKLSRLKSVHEGEAEKPS
jgi:predicted adenylyl cyclase CyaB